jgi:hypothetical protein
VSGCEFCARAAVQMEHGFHAQCRGCNARVAARSPFFFESRQVRAWTADYRALIERLGVTHEEVLAAAKTDRLKGER